MPDKTTTRSPRSTGGDGLDETVRQAYAHWKAHNIRQAEEIALKAIAQHPSHAGALNLLGQIAYSRGQLPQAIAFMQRACQAPEVPPFFFSNLAEMLRQAGQLGPAEGAARKSVKADPRLPGGWGNLGIILQESGQLEESLVCLERALALEPNTAELHNNLGNTLKRLGRLHDAETHWTTAWTLKPNYAEPHSNLALLLIDQGHIERAIAEAHRAIALNPRLPDAYINLASAHTARQSHHEALRALDTLVRFAPNHPTGLAARAVALKQLDRMDEAVACARRAVAVAPLSGEAHNALGQVLQALGDFDEAMAHFDRAAVLPGNSKERALVNRAVLLMEHGRSAEALTAFDAAVAEYPASASAWFNRADVVKFTAGDPSVARLEALLAQDELSQINRMLFDFALGKAYLDIGDSDRAFLHLNRANAAKRSTVSYDPGVATRTMTELVEVFTAEVLARAGTTGVGSELPVFVVGMPRSGTTLVEQILSSHPDVRGAGELRYLPSIQSATPGYPRSVPQLAAEQLKRAGQAYLSAVQRIANGRERVIDKMPANFLALGFIRLILPDARIIHCRRDPADTCLSCYSKLFQSEQNFTYDLRELGRFYRDYERLMEHWRAVLPPSHFIEVDYEAVVADTETEARRLVEFLGLPWNDACLRFFEAPRQVRTASVNQVRQPIYTASVGRWRKHEANLAPLLAELSR